jgi:hypothetical protein
MIEYAERLAACKQYRRLHVPAASLLCAVLSIIARRRSEQQA